MFGNTVEGKTESVQRGVLDVEELFDLRENRKLGFTYLPKGACIVRDADPAKKNNPKDFLFFNKYDHVLKINSNSLCDLILGKNYNQLDLEIKDIVGIQLYGNSVSYNGVRFVSSKKTKEDAKNSKGIMDYVKKNISNVFNAKKNNDILSTFPNYVKTLVVTRERNLRKSVVLPHSYELMNGKYNGNTHKILEGGIHIDFSSVEEVLREVESNNLHTLFVFSKGTTLACDKTNFQELYSRIGLKNVAFYDPDIKGDDFLLAATNDGISPKTVYRKTTGDYIDFFIQ